MAIQDKYSLNRGARDVLQSVAEASNRSVAVPSSEGASLLVITDTDGSYPATAQAVYTCIPQEVDADDTEGATATFAGDSGAKVYVVNVGSAVPPQGTYAIAHLVGGRWQMRWDG